MRHDKGFSAIMLLISLVLIGFLIMIFLNRQGVLTGGGDAQGSGYRKVITKAREAVSKAQDQKILSDEAEKAMNQ